MKKKNKLYTVNKWNRPAFMPEENIFALAGQMNTSNPLLKAYNSTLGNTGSIIGSSGTTTASGAGGRSGSTVENAATSQYLVNQGAYQMDNPWSFKEAFGKDALKAGLKAGAGAAISAGAGVIGGLAGNAISGGLESGAGNTIGSIGSTVGSAVGAVNPLLGAAVSVGSQVLGGLTNAAFGTKVDQEKLNAVNAGIQTNNNFISNAGSFDDIKGPQATVTDTDVYSGGWFSSGKAAKKNEELRQRMIDARSFASRSVDNNILNLQNDQLNNALANYTAFGGPIDVDPSTPIGYSIYTDRAIKDK